MKKISAIIGFILVGFLLWYLIIKPYDYLVTFKVKTSAGTINQTIKLWNTSLANLNPVKQENIANLSQQIEINDSIHNYKWSISSTNLDNVANVEKMLPKGFIKSNGFEITKSCKEYISNLIQGEDYPAFVNGFPQYAKLECKVIKKKLPKYKS